MNVTAPADTVAVGDTSTIMVTLYGAGQISGTYTTTFNINTNDPSNSIVTIPVTMNVSGPAIVSLSDSCLDFGSVMQGASLDRTLEVYNTGCDTLIINNATVPARCTRPRWAALRFLRATRPPLR